MKRGVFWVLLLSLVGLGSVWSVQAATFNSSNFSINGNLGDSAAGGQSSTNYQLTSAAGESVAGQSSSKSYKLAQGYIPTIENSLQVVTQPNGLKAYWPLDDVVSAGTMFDETQYSNNGAYSTDSTSLTGKVGNAWSDFNTNQSITVPHSASLPSGNKMTVSTWVRSDALTTERGIITKWNYDTAYLNNQGQWAFQTAPVNNRLRVFITSGANDDGQNYVDTTSTDLVSNTWAHVAFVYDGTLANAQRVKIFVNGVQKTTTTTGTIPATMYASSDPVTIGDFPGLNRAWSGSIDEMKIYDRALTAADLKADYDATNVGIPAGLSLGPVTPGTSQTSVFDSIVQTSAGGYTLAINQNNNLTSGGNTIPAVSGSIGSPVTWSEGSTKGLGFTLFGTNATALPGTWSSGAAYAALPGSPTSFYTRSNYSGGTKDVINMRLKLDTQTSQVSGNYTNQMVVTGTMIP